MSGIFVSYRRKVSKTLTYRLVDELQRQFGEPKVLFDVASIDPGLPYSEAIKTAIDRCSVVLIVIGPQWLSMTDVDGSPRLDDPEDGIRREVEIALNSDARVVPVLVDGAQMPGADQLPNGMRHLAELQAVALAEDPAHWKFDVARLVETLGRIDPGLREDEQEPGRDDSKEQPVRSVKAIVALVLLGGTAMMFGAVQESMDTDTAVGVITLGLAGLGLAVWAFFDIKTARTRGRGLAITGIVLGVLVTLAGLGSIGDAAAAGAVSFMDQKTRGAGRL